MLYSNKLCFIVMWDHHIKNKLQLVSQAIDLVNNRRWIDPGDIVFLGVHPF